MKKTEFWRWEGQGQNPNSKNYRYRGKLLRNSRDARTHLKMIGSGVGGIELMIDGFSKKGNGPTDRRTDGRTDPLIEMRGRI